jgi:Ca-activated chloride channel homolog
MGNAIAPDGTPAGRPPYNDSVICLSRPSARLSGLLVLLVAALVLLPARPGPAQTAAQAPAETARRVELAVAVLDAKGQPVPEPPGPAGFTVLEDGRPRAVLGASRWAGGGAEGAGAPWEIVVYVDRVLAGTATVRNAAGALAAQAGDLAALGTVEVVVAEPEPDVVLRPTREVYALDEALSRLALGGEGRDDLRGRRRRFRALSQAEREAEATPAVEDEARLVRRQQERLAAWLAERPRRGPRALFLVSDGWDLDPRAFYGRPAQTTSASEAAAALSAGAAAQARTLAALGWTVVALPVGDAALTVPGAWRLPQPGEPRRLPGRGVTLPGRRTPEQEARDKEKERERAAPLLLDARAPLQLLAEASGGELLASPLEMPGALARLRSRLRLVYETGSPAAVAHPVEVRLADAKLQVRAPRWEAAGLPEDLDALRARRLLTGEGESGSLPIDAALQPTGMAETSPASGAPAGSAEPGESPVPAQEGAPAGSPAASAATPGAPALLAPPAPIAPAAPSTGPDPAAPTLPTTPAMAVLEIRLDPASFPERPPAAPLRLTLAVPGSGDDGDERAEVSHRLLAAGDLSAAGGWTYRAEVPLPAGADRVAVTLSEPASGGLWGGALAALLVPVPDDISDSALLPPPPPVRLVLPEPAVAGPVTGRVRVRAEAAAEASRVAFFLDGRRVGVCGPPPCSAAVGFGREVRPHTLEAVALAADGRELGRDRTRVNRPARPGGLAVRITSPEGGQRNGPVDVAADVQVPPDGRLDRVEFFWNEELAATLYQPPFRARVLVPPGRTGYLRVAARLADGTLAEDAVPVNAAEIGERVDVRLVELFVVVTDGTGRPVRGLGRDEFRVLQDGTEQRLAGFDDAGELPLTLALAVDSSASMFRKLPGVVRAARSLVRDGLAAGRDSTLLVDFDSEPRLTRRPTRDLGTLSDALESLRPDGRTALWRAIDYSLAQLQGIAGRKALVMFSDGIGDGEDIPYGPVLRRVRESGVPVYLIVTHPQAARGGGKLADRPTLDRLRRLGELSGGRVYFVTAEQDPAPLYREILAELRSQYVLSYYPPDPEAAAESEPWREVEVEVKRRGLVARTLSGFFGG